MTRFQDQVAIVTGASEGIGRATAQTLARDGAAVLLVARNAGKLEEVAADIQSAGGRAIVVAGDAALAATADTAVARALDAWGRVDILVNNVGGSTILGELRAAPMEQFALEDWHKLVEFNLDPTFLFCRGVLPHMKRARLGKIVNVASIAARGLGTSSAGYCAAKAGIVALTKKLSLEAGPFNVNVNAIAPALTVTDRLRFFWEGKDQAEQQAYLETIALRRVGTAQDQANVACFLASADAAFVTGVTIDVNGGQY